MKRTHQWLIFILSLGFLLRILPLNQSYWLDEAINVRAVSRFSYQHLTTTYALGDFHPPLYHWLLKSWVYFWGNSEVSTRMLSVMFGLVTIYATYQICELVFDKRSLKLGKLKLPFKILPPLLLSISGLHIYYSGEARMYMLTAMFASLSILFLLKWQSVKTGLKSPSTWALILSLIGLLYSDYVAWLLMPLFLLLSPVPTIIALIFLLPWLPYLYQQLQIGLGVASDFPLWNQVVGGFSVKNVVLVPIKFVIGRVAPESNLVYALLALSIVALLLLVAYQWWRSRTWANRQFQVILGWLLIPLVIGIGLSLKISLLSYFRFIFVLPAFYIVLVKGLQEARPVVRAWLVSLLLVVTLISTLSYLSLPQFQREDWRSFSEWIDTDAPPEALTLIPNYAQADPYLYYQSRVPIYDNLDNLTPRPATVYLVRYLTEIFDESDHLRTGLEELGYVLVDKRGFNGVLVWKYQYKSELYAWGSGELKIR